MAIPCLVTAVLFALIMIPQLSRVEGGCSRFWHQSACMELAFYCFSEGQWELDFGSDGGFTGSLKDVADPLLLGAVCQGA